MHYVFRKKHLSVNVSYIALLPRVCVTLELSNPFQYGSMVLKIQPYTFAQYIFSSAVVLNDTST